MVVLLVALLFEISPLRREKMSNANLRFAPIVGTVSGIEHVLVRRMEPAQKYDGSESSKKGENTWNWLCASTLPQDEGRIMYARRFRGTMVGNHFHPRCKNKDPERFMLVSGAVTFWFLDIFGKRKEETLVVNPETGIPILVTIPPYILHGMTVTSPFACFLEQQSTPFCAEESYSAEEFSLLEV